ncbi:MAG: 50S ribosomal protein L21 [Firmicutes bacterium]|nr:50S ribosomal protein L21 [Bacillota bacterium]
MYAIIKTGGKQLRVEPGQTVKVEKLSAQKGETVEFTEVLLAGGEGELYIGRPFVTGARVWGKVLGTGKGRKILVFHYKPKKNIRRRRGHRQPFTMVRIEAIEVSS